ncbi:MAG: cupin domain-containing protein [Elusimicrobia bacterium CG_4_10_14_0_2_um_filter_56_8]|nr:MAG: cupin [Elusimicrobia bacterium CG1_02_56_21]PJA13422.1 MAG: cupin domain-containing protein [Elusimicrobia bacterium CG_4_10_14_0_2_um_filter_56_8]
MKIESQEELTGKALKAKDLVKYDKGAVVSRTILQKKTGTVTIFSFDKGQGLSEHTAPFDAMVEILDGEAEIFIAGKPHKVKAGEFIIMPANKPHSLKAVKKFKMALVMIRS